MKHHVVSRYIGALAIVIAAAFVLNAIGAQAQSESGTPSPQDPCRAFQDSDSPGSEATPAANAHDMEMDVEFDLMFIDMMIPHHQSAITMAEVALARSSNEEIRTLAGDIIAEQAAEIEQMMEWRESWYPGAPVTPEDHAMESMDMGDSGMMAMEGDAMLAELCAAGDVDVVFIEMMIPHHESAIVMAGAALEQAERDELRELAKLIVASQSAEIELMQELLAGLAGTPTARG